MIYCVWYPSGGFGHYIGAVISFYGKNFIRPLTKLDFSSNGNSHAVKLLAPTWIDDPDSYSYNFDPARNHCVLIDNGVTSQSEKFKSVIPNPIILKIIFDDWSLPVIAHTMVVKAMRSSLEAHCLQDIWWSNQDWSKRQKFFIFLRDHKCRGLWNADNTCVNIDIADIVNYQKFKLKLESAGLVLADFSTKHQEWCVANEAYIKPALVAQEVVNYVAGNEAFALNHITDLWTQAVVYYYLWVRYGVELDHHKQVAFFKDTTEIRSWLANKGVL
jgi:hypothetical protein